MGHSTTYENIRRRADWAPCLTMQQPYSVKFAAVQNASVQTTVFLSEAGYLQTKPLRC